MEVAPGVHRLGSGYVNWYVISDGDGLTLVDAGMPGQWGQLVDVVAALGRSLSDVEAVVLTHAHADHLGFTDRAARQTGAQVHVSGDDAGPGNRRFPPLRLYVDPRSWPWLLHSTLAGLLFTPDLRSQRAFDDGATLDVPGRPTVVAVPGHTRGSAALHLSDRGVLFTGDALVTFDPYTRRRGPGLMLPGVNTDDERALRSLDRLFEVAADVVLPGHGEPWTGGTAAAVAQARRARGASSRG